MAQQLCLSPEQITFLQVQMQASLADGLEDLTQIRSRPHAQGGFGEPQPALSPARKWLAHCKAQTEELRTAIAPNQWRMPLGSVPPASSQIERAEPAGPRDVIECILNVRQRMEVFPGDSIKAAVIDRLASPVSMLCRARLVCVQTSSLLVNMPVSCSRSAHSWLL